MAHSTYDFYGECVSKWITNPNASVLVIGAGVRDAEVFRKVGMPNVTLIDLDARVLETAGDYKAYRQDAENLQYDDGSFDYVVAHAVLHHCRSPHRALLEMHRVARHGVLAIEARDSLTIRIARRLGMSSLYETAAVRSHQGQSGGVANSHIPNHVYRWTQAEFRKTIRSYCPQLRHHFKFSHAVHYLPLVRAMAKPGMTGRLARLAGVGIDAITALAPGQRNLFAMFVEKPPVPQGLQPWLRPKGDGLEFDMEWSGRD